MLRSNIPSSLVHSSHTQAICGYVTAAAAGKKLSKDVLATLAAIHDASGKPTGLQQGDPGSIRRSVIKELQGSGQLRADPYQKDHQPKATSWDRKENWNQLVNGIPFTRCRPDAARLTSPLDPLHSSRPDAPSGDRERRRVARSSSPRIRVGPTSSESYREKVIASQLTSTLFRRLRRADPGVLQGLELFFEILFLSSSENELQSTRPSPDVLKKRDSTTARLLKYINDRFGAEVHYRIRPFGSTEYKMDSANSDLDLVILDPKLPFGLAPGSRKDSSIYNVQRIAKLLTRYGYRDVDYIRATVPIVKFTDPTTGISCDVNVNDRLGLINTRLIRQYFLKLPSLHPAMFLIKQWAKPIGLNNPSAKDGGVRTFSSYALCLMMIGFAQTKGWLPCLQRKVGPKAGERHHYFWIDTRSGTIACDVRFAHHDWWKPWLIPAEKALLGWFKYWGEEHRYDEDMMSVKSGGLLPRTHRRLLLEAKQPPPAEVESEDEDIETQTEEIDDPHEFDEDFDPVEFAQRIDPKSEQAAWANDALVVPDVFIPTKNVTSGVQPASIAFFREQCMVAYRMLSQGSSLDDLFAHANDTGAQIRANRSNRRRR
ncbi:hypothetical protein K474DRAFT_1773153 [Panus rudis PR-1116 ss-1]|nr:hypothetical protein K474DRAFT_1773153 [Panus rudis PR-1116 ss-1]